MDSYETDVPGIRRVDRSGSIRRAAVSKQPIRRANSADYKGEYKYVDGCCKEAVAEPGPIPRTSRNPVAAPTTDVAWSLRKRNSVSI